MKLKTYKDFINEAIYLGLKGLKSYSIKSIRPGMRKNDHGHAIVNLVHFDDKVTDLLIETYGQPKDKELIVKIFGSSYEINEDRFKTVIEKLTYLLNKNQLGEYFKLESIMYDKDLESYAILKTDSIIPIDKLEQILTSTKIINPKVKDSDDLDKMIYQTHNESNNKKSLEEWLKENEFKQDSDGGYSTDGNIDLEYDDPIIRNGQLIVQLNHVKGHFYADECDLISLYNFPKTIDSGFYADENDKLSYVEKTWYYNRAVHNKIGYGNYWFELLTYMIKEKKSLEQIKGWPDGFLDSNLVKSVKSIGKFNL